MRDFKTNFNDDKILVVPDDFVAAPGAELEAAGLVLVSARAKGAQGAVWSLAFSSSSRSTTKATPTEPLPGVVAKIANSTALISEIEREWQVGRRLNTLAVEIEGEDEDEGEGERQRRRRLPRRQARFPHGFATMGMAIRTSSGRFRGFLMERVPGETLAELVADPSFADVELLRSALESTFSALDSAQGALGFQHYDLRPPNVMVFAEEEGAGGEKEERAATSTTSAAEREEGEKRKKKKTKAVVRAKIIDYGLALFDNLYYAGPDDAIPVPDSSSFASFREETLRRPPPKDDATSSLPRGTRPFFPFARADAADLEPPRASLFERVHRVAWRRRSDVYHLLLGLAEALDGRTWPLTKAKEVEAMMSFVMHVTGVKPRAFFSALGRGGESGRDDEEAEATAATTSEGEGEIITTATTTTTPLALADALAFKTGFGRAGKPAHALRRWLVRLRAWTTPRSPMISAAEALTAPLFTKRQSCRVRFV